MKTDVLYRDSAFFYRCNACCRCCVNKRIQTNPYEVLRLSRQLGLSTGEFTRRYIEQDGPYLRVTAGGICVFLTDKGCSVHNDRPLACRTYPLGRWVSAGGEETFRELKPHPQTEGIYGQDGTVEEYLTQQGALPYMEAADLYQALFYRLFDALQQVLPDDEDLPDSAQSALFSCVDGDLPAFMEWLDVDSAVEGYCIEKGQDQPNDIAESVQLHILSIDQWLDSTSGESP